MNHPLTLKARADFHQAELRRGGQADGNRARTVADRVKHTLLESGAIVTASS